MKLPPSPQAKKNLFYSFIIHLLSIKQIQFTCKFDGKKCMCKSVETAAEKKDEEGGGLIPFSLWAVNIVRD